MELSVKVFLNVRTYSCVSVKLGTQLNDFYFSATNKDFLIIRLSIVLICFSKSRISDGTCKQFTDDKSESRISRHIIYQGRFFYCQFSDPTKMLWTKNSTLCQKMGLLN